ncbi:MAG: DUF2334 domain-containing protein [Euryarchaeota archaeon]|nr:DUF2334 domain-containing protein [Euryarchaeota archaeon]
MKKYFFLYAVLILFLSYTNGFYTYIAGGYYTVTHTEIEEEFEEFSIAEYPFSYNSVFLLTVDDISYYTNPAELQEFLEYVNGRGVSPTLFVIPCHAGKKVTEGPEIIKILQKYDLEVAQHGYQHVEKEFKSKSYEEQVEMITKGREILEKEFTIYGFRSPGFYRNFTTAEVLNDLGFAYETEMSLFDTFYMRDLLQLPHTPNGRVFMTHSLKSLDIPEGAWTPTMKEFADWWKFRNDLAVRYNVEGNELSIYLSDYRKGLAITLKKDYKVHVFCVKELDYEWRGNTIILQS